MRPTPSLLVALLVPLFASLAACGQAPERIAQRQVALELSGLDCGGCAQKVSTALRGVQGVTWAEVDHETLRARVTCGEGTDPAELVRAVREAGQEFSARLLTQ